MVKGGEQGRDRGEREKEIERVKELERERRGRYTNR